MLYPLITLAAITYGIHEHLTHRVSQQPPVATPPNPIPVPTDILPSATEPSPVKTVNPAPLPDLSDPAIGCITMKADKQGHFRGTVAINGVAMPCLIDTGATKTVIPAKLAAIANLPHGEHIQAQTAGGSVEECKTSIDKLEMGNVQIQNLDANINEHLDEVLIGMNTLKYFHMTQDDQTLTLTPNSRLTSQTAQTQNDKVNTLAVDQPLKKSRNVVKSVVCDNQHVCKTTYADH